MSNKYPYQILPFKHVRFNDHELLLVNEAGDFYFISIDDFDKFIGYGLPKKNDVFLDLKSNHFLIDTNIAEVIDLLSTKYRTRKRFLNQFTSFHMMVITYRCNHKCRYCQVSSEDSGSYRWDMSPETARRIVDYIFCSPSDEIKIEFQGGEPLLNWETVKETIEYAEQKNKKSRKALEFVVSTNLTLIDRNKLDYLKFHNVYISTSLDGPKSIHDKNRLLRTGGSSYDLFIKKLELTRNILGPDKVSALMTTTKDNLYRITDVVDEYIKLGFDGVFFRALNPYGLAAKNESLHYPIEEFVKSFKEGLKYIIRLNLKGIRFVEYYSTLLLSRILTHFPTGFVDLQSPSGAGICGVIYDYNGDVYPSDEARMLAKMGDKRFLMGNVFKDTYYEIFHGKVMTEIVEKSCVETMPGCATCAFQIYCGADPIRNYLETKDIVGHRPTSDFCEKNKEIIKFLFEIIKDNDEDVQDVLWSWITKRDLKEIRGESFSRYSNQY